MTTACFAVAETTFDGGAPSEVDHDHAGGPASLVRRAVAGDQAAREALLAQVRPHVMRYCRGRLGRMAGSYYLADDVAQEVCLGVLRALPSYQEMGRPFMAFVYGIAGNKVADAWRREDRSTDLADELPHTADTAPGPEEVALRASEADRVRALLSHLPGRQRELVWLRVAVGLSAEETGKAMGMSAGAVRVAQYRALQQLRALASEEAE